jgi:hypothetical protein
MECWRNPYPMDTYLVNVCYVLDIAEVPPKRKAVKNILESAWP